jgi:riboflavin synthase
VFTGIVRERARVLSFADGRLVVQTSVPAELGDSVAIDGVCLTVVERENGRLGFDVIPESLSRMAGFGSEVNVEPSLRVGDPLGGHYVQGHVDGIGRIRSIESQGSERRVWIAAPAELLRYCVEKGSIAVAGVALTISGLGDDAFEVSLIPHTLAETTLGALGPGNDVNLEVDVLAKYVERLGARGGGYDQRQ